MAFLDWKPEFESGAPAFDRPHQRLVAIINRLHDELKMGASADALQAILAGLIQQTHAHFRDEESALQQSGYPRLREHHREHEELTATLIHFQKDMEKGRITLSIQLLNFLKAWLRDHIQGSDQASSATRYFGRCIIVPGPSGQPAAYQTASIVVHTRKNTTV